MATKELQTRIALKYDSYSAWTSSPGKDLILLKGEIGICEIPSTNATATTAPTTLFKVGDGVNTFENLNSNVEGAQKTSNQIKTITADNVEFSEEKLC